MDLNDAGENDGSHKESGERERDDIQADNEEAMIDSVLGASHVDPKPKVDIRSWKDLWEQLKDNIVNTHKKHARLTTMNQLFLLHNFATLQIKGVGRMAVSQEITQQWHEGEGEGTHFAHQVHILARHYQVYEQLPTQIVGGYRGYSIFNNERMQIAAQDWLLRLPTGEVSPRHFCRALTKDILPCLGLNKESISEWTARRWLVKLGWRRTHLKKGVYMDGHE